MHRNLLSLAGLTLMLVTAVASADPVADAADRILAAFQAKDEAGLKSLAEKGEPNPWLVADALCARGELDAAEAFARAAQGVDVKSLPTYLASRRGKPDDARARERLARAFGAIAARQYAEAVTEAGEPPDAPEDIVSIGLLHARGLALRELGRLKESAEDLRRAAEASERIGWLAEATVASYESAESAYMGSDFLVARERFQRMTAIEERRNSPVGVARGYMNIATTHLALGEYPRTLELYEQAERMMVECGDRAGQAMVLGNIGDLHYRLGDYLEAAEIQKQALKLKEELGDRAGAAATLGNLGAVYSALGDNRASLETLERALSLRRDLGDRIGAAESLGNIGFALYLLGDFRKALEIQEQAQRLMEEIGDRAGMARTLSNIGAIHLALGDFPAALRFEERALRLGEEIGNQVLVAEKLVSMGNIHNALGDHQRALGFLERALAILEESGDRRGLVLALSAMGQVHRSVGDCAAALHAQERVLALCEEMGDRLRVARTLVNIGLNQGSLGDDEAALASLERSLALSEEIGDKVNVATALGGIAIGRAVMGDHERALDCATRALAIAEEVGSTELLVRGAWHLAAVHEMRGAPLDAVRFARQAIMGMGGLLRGLEEEEGARARGEFADLFSTGAVAARDLSDPSELSFFLESGRAGSLLEGLGGREKLSVTAIPQELLDQEAKARGTESVAVHRLHKAQEGKDREEIAARRRELSEARAAVMDAIARIQREAKREADLLYPSARPLAEIAKGLREGEALVSYGLFAEDALALVVTPGQARIVTLPPTKEIESAPVEKLRDLVVEPLRLDPKTTRLLISPDGALSYVPFVLLAPDREIAYVPSGTTYLLLRDESAKRGKGVLAVGDPDYGGAPDPGALSLLHRGDGFPRLLASGDEAKAIGDTVLLGKDASEPRFAEALAACPRWRAVHLACHGIVDPEQPVFSSLALSREGQNDGLLTALDVYRMRIPADLAVLSACETAKGRIYTAEGVVGFTRAFLFAGASRVIVSIWKVDDEATKALMVKFYGLWNPKDPSLGMPAATALKKAQEFVRDHSAHPEWRDPKYWAAWQLWGLPE